MIDECEKEEQIMQKFKDLCEQRQTKHKDFPEIPKDFFDVANDPQTKSPTKYGETITRLPDSASPPRSYEDFLDQSAPPDSDGGYREQPPY